MNHEAILREISKYLRMGIVDLIPTIVSGGESLSSSDLEGVYVISAPFGEVTISSMQMDNNVASDVVLYTELYGRFKSISLDADSNPLVIYKRA